MKLLNSKKADGFRILNYGFWRMLFISIMFLTLFLLVSSQIKTKIDIYDLRAAIFAQRLLNSPNGISYSSEYNSRNYPGIIPLQKFNDQALRQLNNDSDRFSASIMLEDIENNNQNEIFVSKKWFERYYPLSKFGKYHGNLMWRYVIIKNNTDNTLKKGRTLIKTVEKNE